MQIANLFDKGYFTTHYKSDIYPGYKWYISMLYFVQTPSLFAPRVNLLPFTLAQNTIYFRYV